MFLSLFSAGTRLPSRLISWHVFQVVLNKHFMDDAADVQPALRVFRKLSYKQELPPQDFGF